MPADLQRHPAYLHLATCARRARSRARVDERGEGVISAAIAVLVMAFLGAGMYLAFSRTIGKAESKTDRIVCNVGSDAPGGTPVEAVGC